MKVPNECTPIEPSPQFEQLLQEVSVAVHHMQFGDMIWIAVQNGSQTRVSELIAGFIHNNLGRWTMPVEPQEM